MEVPQEKQASKQPAVISQQPTDSAQAITPEKSANKFQCPLCNDYFTLEIIEVSLIKITTVSDFSKIKNFYSGSIGIPGGGGRNIM